MELAPVLDPVASRAGAPAATSERLLARLRLAGYAATALALASLIVLAFAPGLVGDDSSHSFRQARAWAFTDNRHPVMLSLVWRLTDSLLPGPLGLLVLLAAATSGSVVAIFAQTRPRATLANIVCASLTIGVPPVFILLGWLVKDVLLAASALALIAVAIAPRSPRWWWLRAGVFLVLGVVAIGSRHPSPAAVAPIFVLFASRGARNGLGPRARGFVASVAIGLLLAACTIAVNKGIDRVLIPKEGHYDLVGEWLAIWDLQGISYYERTNLFPERYFPNVTREAIQTLYQAPNHGMWWRQAIAIGIPELVWDWKSPRGPEVRRIWLGSILRYPQSYLRHRAKQAVTLLGIDPTHCPFFVQTIEAGLAQMDRAHLPGYLPEGPQPSALQQAVDRLHWRQFPRQWYRPILYLVGCGVLLVLAWATPLPTRDVVLCLAVSGIANAIAYVLGTLSYDYRFLHWTVVCAVLGTSLLCRDAVAATAARLRWALARDRGGRSTSST